MPGSQLVPPCRLFVLFARAAHLAVLFRRGPSQWTQLILWNIDTDTFHYGQWFRGRIYERRSDLSPDGTKLIYFASKFSTRTLRNTDYTYAWTAISKPPYLTALALWPKGNCWHGGGLFIDNQTILLNHKPAVAQPHPQHLPQNLDIRPNPDAQGEDDPLFGQRLTRDGWHIHQEWQVRYAYTEGGFITDVPEIRRRNHPDNPSHHLLLTRTLDHYLYSEKFSLQVDPQIRIPLEETTQWADWDHHGRLIQLVAGRIRIGILSYDNNVQWTELIDLNGQQPEPKKAPTWATQW